MISLYIAGYFGVGVLIWCFCWMCLLYDNLQPEEILGFIVAWPAVVAIWLGKAVKFLVIGWVWCTVNLCDGVVGAIRKVSEINGR